MEPKETHDDKNSLFEHVRIVHRGETKKFGTNPGYRLMHDLIYHSLSGSMLDCWRIEAKGRNAEWTSLEEFAVAEPSWETIVSMSEDIARKYVATGPDLDDVRTGKDDSQRDQIFENQCLRNRDEFLYVDLCRAIREGDVGRLKTLLLPWIYLFKATGKHKYASHMTRFLKDLYELYSEDIRFVVHDL